VLKVSNLTGLALTVLGGTGIVGIILGFASRDIVENFLASFFLSLHRPFRTGDYIAVSGSEGIVQSLNTRSTVLLTLEGALVQVPNGMVFKDKITNLSASPSRRAEFTVGIGHDSPISEVQTLILEVLTTHSGVLSSPEPLVLVDSLGAATVNLRCLYWFDTKTYSPIKIRSALLRLTKNKLLESGISLPDATREVIFPQGVPVIEVQKDSLRPKASRKPQHPAVKGRQKAATEAEGGLLNEEKDAKCGVTGPAMGWRARTCCRISNI
jgi:small-conductance mechanosensitive channel